MHLRCGWVGLVFLSSLGCGSSPCSSESPCDGGANPDASSIDAPSSDAPVADSPSSVDGARSDDVFASSGDAPAAADARGPDSGGRVATCPSIRTLSLSEATSVAIVGGPPDPVAGIAFPSVVYPAGAPVGYMAYTRFTGTPDYFSIHIASSTDGGATWTHQAQATSSSALTVSHTDRVECATGTCTGLLVGASSTLVDDATAPDPDQRWKLFVHQYLVESRGLAHPSIGRIVMLTAPDPTGPYAAPVGILGWSSGTAYSSADVRLNVSSVDAIRGCENLQYPSAIARGDEIDMALECASRGDQHRIVWLRSLDHGATWIDGSRSLERGDVACLGYAEGDPVHPQLFLSPSGDLHLAATNYSSGGCLVFPIADATTGAVARDGRGTAEAASALSIASTAYRFRGCGFAEAVGYLATWSEGGSLQQIVRGGSSF